MAKRAPATSGVSTRVRGLAGNHTMMRKQSSREALEQQDGEGTLRVPWSEKEEPFLQRQASKRAVEPETVPPIVNEVLRSAGRPLDLETRAFFEPRFSHDLSRVRVHTEGKAAESSRAVNALAYNVGQHLVFAAHRYVPETFSGRALLAHELVHTLQTGRHHSVGGQLKIATPDAPQEVNANRIADGVMGSRGSSAGAAAASGPAASLTHLYRQPAPGFGQRRRVVAQPCPGPCHAPTGVSRTYLDHDRKFVPADLTSSQALNIRSYLFDPDSTEFAEYLMKGFTKQTYRGEKLSFVVPIMQAHYMGKGEIVGYVLRYGEGNLGWRVTITRYGDIVGEEIAESPIESEGLGPVDWLPLTGPAARGIGMLGRGAFRFAAGHEAGFLAARELGTVGAGRVGFELGETAPSALGSEAMGAGTALESRTAAAEAGIAGAPRAAHRGATASTEGVEWHTPVRDPVVEVVPRSAGGGGSRPPTGLSRRGGGGRAGGGSQPNSGAASRSTRAEIREVREATIREREGQVADRGRASGADDVRTTLHPRTSAPGPSGVLGAELRRAGDLPPGEGFNAHHIVPSSAPPELMARLEELQARLEAAHIPINSARNGAWLPESTEVANEYGRVIHQQYLHRYYEEYLATIEQRLMRLRPEGISAELAKIKAELESGTFKFLY